MNLSSMDSNLTISLLTIVMVFDRQALGVGNVNHHICYTVTILITAYTYIEKGSVLINIIPS